MKITVMNNKLVPFEEIAEGTVFRDPAGDIYYIKTALVSVVDKNFGTEEWNSLRLDNYTFDCFGPKDLVLPIYNAELIIP
mgnify:CR=1 FL=1